MTRSHDLESQLERLLKYGTFIFSAIIAMGVLLDSLDAKPIPIDLVSLGIIGFITLPVVRLVVMLRHYVLSHDIAISRVVALVLVLVVAGMILGVIL